MAARDGRLRIGDQILMVSERTAFFPPTHTNTTQRTFIDECMDSQSVQSLIKTRIDSGHNHRGHPIDGRRVFRNNSMPDWTGSGKTVYSVKFSDLNDRIANKRKRNFRKCITPIARSYLCIQTMYSLHYRLHKRIERLMVFNHVRVLLRFALRCVEMRDGVRHTHTQKNVDDATFAKCMEHLNFYEADGCVIMWMLDARACNVIYADKAEERNTYPVYYWYGICARNILCTALEGGRIECCNGIIMENNVFPSTE